MCLCLSPASKRALVCVTIVMMNKKKTVSFATGNRQRVLHVTSPDRSMDAMAFYLCYVFLNISIMSDNDGSCNFRMRSICICTSETHNKLSRFYSYKIPVLLCLSHNALDFDRLDLSVCLCVCDLKSKIFMYFDHMWL